MTASYYPGNAALPAEVRQRVLSTFQQVVQTYLRGNLQEASVGCEFVLRIDPEFAPARQLAGKIRNPETPLDVDAMLASLGSPATQEEVSPLEAAQAALETRDFSRAADLANRVLQEDLTNIEAQRIANEAQEKIEADPFIAQFLQGARQKFAGGNRSGARTELEKARQLDPRHPSVLDFERMMASAPQAEQPAQSFAPGSSLDFGFDSTPGLGRPTSDAFVPPAEPEPAPQGGFDFSGAFGSTQTPDAEPPSDFSFGFSAEPPPPEEPEAPPPPEAPADEGGFSFGFDAPAEPASAEMPSFASFDSTPEPAAPPSAPAEGFGGFGDPAAPDTSDFMAPGESTETAPSEFGFTFEDDQKPPDSFTGGFQQPAVGEAQTFDFSTAAVETTDEDRAKIGQILIDGDSAYDRGEYQEAIDIWSRIFLIDVTNEAATERIEKARRIKQEAERGIEGLMIEASTAAERGDHVTARAKYDEVLRIDPSHMAARDGIDRLDAEGAPPIPPSPRGDVWAEEGETAAGFEPIAPPDAPPAAPTTAPAARPKKRGLSGAAMAVAAVLLLAVVGGGAWWFLRSGSEASTIDSAAAIERGERLAAAGDYDGAIAALLTVPAEDSNYSRAVQLLDEYRKRRAEGAAATRGGATDFNQELQRGRTAFAAGDFVTAQQALTAASSAQPLPPDAAQMLAQAQEKVNQLAPVRAMFAAERWPDAVAALRPMREQDPANANVRDMLAAAHFNQGVAALRESDTAEAVQAFDAALAVNPEDRMAARSRELAAKYDREEKDLLYQIYVKYLPLRTF